MSSDSINHHHYVFVMPIYLGPRRTDRYLGQSNIPRDIQVRRRSVAEMLRRMGTPMLVKHRYNDLDFKSGVAVKSPEYDDIYEQTRNRDPISFGVGYVSAELSSDEWYDATGTIVKSAVSPGTGWTQAPRFRGYGPANLTYIIEPDRAQDFYKATLGGPIFKIQTAEAIASWWPDINDNDLIINVTLGPGEAVIEANERFEAKNVNPVSMRGQDRQGRKEYGESFGNTHVVNQKFEMALVPATDIIYEVDTDR